MRRDEVLRYMPSIKMHEALEAEDLHASVKIKRKKHSKDITLKLQCGLEEDGAVEVTWGGVPLEQMPTEEDVDGFWEGLVGTMRSCIKHKD